MFKRKPGKIENGVKIGEYPNTNGFISKDWREYFKEHEAHLYNRKFRNSAERKLAKWGTNTLKLSPACYFYLNRLSKL